MYLCVRMGMCCCCRWCSLSMIMFLSFLHYIYIKCGRGRRRSVVFFSSLLFIPASCCCAYVVLPIRSTIWEPWNTTIRFFLPSFGVNREKSCVCTKHIPRGPTQTHDSHSFAHNDYTYVDINKTYI